MKGFPKQLLIDLEGTTENILLISDIVLLQYSSIEATIIKFCCGFETLSKAP